MSQLKHETARQGGMLERLVEMEGFLVTVGWVLLAYHDVGLFPLVISHECSWRGGTSILACCNPAHLCQHR